MEGKDSPVKRKNNWMKIRTNSTLPSRCWWGLTAFAWHLQNLLNQFCNLANHHRTLTFKGCDRGVNMWGMLCSCSLMWHRAWAVPFLLKRICFFTAQLLQLAVHMTIRVFYGRAGSASPELFLTSFHFALVLCQWSSLQFIINKWRMEQDRGLSRK